VSADFSLICNSCGSKVRARTSMLETIHPAQVLTTRDHDFYQTAAAPAADLAVILGDMPWEVGEPKWGN
jgi:hypothetical protein